MNKKISELVEQTQLDINDEFLFRRGTDNFKIKASNFKVGGAPDYKVNSKSSFVISTALINTVITFVVGAGADALAYTSGVRVRATDMSNTVNFIEGIVTSYSGTNLSMKVDNISGSGTIAAWILNIGGLGAGSATPVTNPQLWVATTGNDSTGDGSNSKPFQTLSRARTAVQQIADANPSQQVTVVVMGGDYSNNVNMVVESKGGVFFTYTIFCFPGVSITQTTTSFYNNQSVNGCLHIYGGPDLRNKDNLGGQNHLIDLRARRNGAAQLTFHLHFRDIVVTDAKPVRIVSVGNNDTGPSVIRFKSATLISNNKEYSVLIDGQDNILAFQCANLSNTVDGSIAMQLGTGSNKSCGTSIYISETRIVNFTPNQNITGIRIGARPVLDPNWKAGADIIPGILITDAYFYFRATGCVGFDITNMGDLSNNVIIKDCMVFGMIDAAGTASKGACLLGAGDQDRITAVNCISQIPIRQAQAVNIQGLVTIAVDKSRGFMTIQNFEF